MTLDDIRPHLTANWPNMRVLAFVSANGLIDREALNCLRDDGPQHIVYFRPASRQAVIQACLAHHVPFHTRYTGEGTE